MKFLAMVVGSFLGALVPLFLLAAIGHYRHWRSTRPARFKVPNMNPPGADNVPPPPWAGSYRAAKRNAEPQEAARDE